MPLRRTLAHFILPAWLCAQACGRASEEADSFEITLHGQACLQPCKAFALRLDESGRVHVHNPSGEPRLATYDVSVPESHARALYRAMLDGGFEQLSERYDVDTDSCGDRTVSVLGLAAESGNKQVVYGRGCATAPPELVALEQRLRDLTGVEQLLAGTAPADCEIDGDPVSFAPVYTVREPDATGVGFLRFTNKSSSERTFIAEGCNGHELARGRVINTPSCSAQLQLDPAGPKRWLGTREELSTLFVDGNGVDDSSHAVSYLSIRHSADAEVAAQVGLLGASCEGGDR